MKVPDPEKTIVFCTAFVPIEGDQYYTWNIRYRIWVEAVRRLGIRIDQILLVDDGSEILPDWPDLTIINEGDDLRCDAPLVLYHFRHRLGRRDISDFPGWVRSFFSVSRYADANDFQKIVHLEADAFLISSRACDYVNGFRDGWIAPWCKRHERPESGIQIIAGSGLETYKNWSERPVESFANKVIETTLPFSQIAYELLGDRYGEYESRVPRSADWCMQAFPSSLVSLEEYFWWMPWFTAIFPELALASNLIAAEVISRPRNEFTHTGIHYTRWLKEAAQALDAQIYFEIGNNGGESIRMIQCDAVCVHPFLESASVLTRRKNTHFYQGTPDEFFSDPAAVDRLFPEGIDLAFLDGLHLVEVLLRDFINTEQLANARSMFVLHDCLPLNERMAQRKRYLGDDSEPKEIRGFWTGDVWKIVPLLAKYRPELHISYVDCPPTGLVVCTGLDRANRVLIESYDQIVREAEALSLTSFGLDNLWGLFPFYKSDQVFKTRHLFDKAYFAERRGPMFRSDWRDLSRRS